jgi:metallo-beta-lactamase class B
VSSAPDNRCPAEGPRRGLDRLRDSDHLRAIAAFPLDPSASRTVPLRRLVVTLAAALLLPAAIAAQGARECPACAEWNTPQRPLRIFGDTYFVGTHGLSAILVTSLAGHVLIDGALPESAPLLRANIEALGFRMADVKVILNSHAHYDHAGGIAELQRASGATVWASPRSAPVIAAGRSGPDDPQYGVLLDYPAVKGVKAFAFGDTIRVGPLALVPHATPGHTAGGTTWTWRACDGARCLDMVYADSQSPISADGFLYSRNTTYPMVLDDFARGQATLESLPCDVLLTPHPGASRMWERIAADGTPTDSLVDRSACARYAQDARQTLAKRLERERSGDAK